MSVRLSPTAGARASLSRNVFVLSLTAVVASGLACGRSGNNSAPDGGTAGAAAAGTSGSADASVGGTSGTGGTAGTSSAAGTGGVASAGGVSGANGGAGASADAGAKGGAGGSASAGASGGVGIGGNTGTSGNTGSGGAGVAGSGGNAGTAGTAGNAGSAGTAGNAGSAGGTPMEITGWTFEDYRGDFNAYPVTPPARGGVVTDSPNGHPGSCLYATLGFKGANEEMRVGVMFSSPRTLTRKTLSAEVFVAAGWTDLAHLGQIRLYLITGAKGDQYAEGPTIDLLIGGTWNMITLDPAAPAVSTGAVDTSLVRGLGVSILSADGPSNTTLVVYVDNVLVHDAP